MSSKSKKYKPKSQKGHAPGDSTVAEPDAKAFEVPDELVHVPKNTSALRFILMIALIIVLLIIWYIDSRSLTLLRLIVFISLGTSSYLISTHPPEWLLEEINLVYLFYGLMMLAAFVRVRLSSNDQFAITPLDYLVIIIAVVVALMPETDVGTQSLTFVAIQMIILFYSAEMIIQKMRSSRNALAGTLLVTLILLSARALL